MTIEEVLTKNAVATVAGETILLRTPYHQSVIDCAHKAQGRWDKDKRAWAFSIWSAHMIAGYFRQNPLIICQNIADEIDRIAQSDYYTRLSIGQGIEEVESAIKKIPGLSENIVNAMAPGAPKLREFQELGVGFAEANGGSVIIADEMGLGKTCQALAVAALHKDMRPLVVVAKPSALYQWQHETLRWIGETSIVCDSKDAINTPADIYIVPWSRVASLAETIIARQPKMIIIDEVHHAKSASAQRTKAVMDICLNCDSLKYRLALSGTPLLNRVKELWTILTMVTRGKFGNWQEFANRYCAPKLMRIGKRRFWNYDGRSNVGELARRLIPVMIRRLKQDVLKELPPKNRMTVWLKSMFAGMTMSELAELECGERTKVFSALSKLRHSCGVAKTENAVAWIEDWLEENEEKQLVVYAYHQQVQHNVATALEKHGVARLAGGQTPLERAEEIKKFRDKQARVIVCSISAAADSINLDTASDLVFVERDWVPGQEHQVEDRIHRLTSVGQVNIYRLMSDHPIDLAIEEVFDSKVALAGSVLGVVESANVTITDIQDAVAKKIISLTSNCK